MSIIITMNEKLYNIIHDPNVNFFIIGTPQLRSLIVAGIHPAVKKLNKEAKAALLDAKLTLPIDRKDIFAFLSDRSQLDENCLFLLENAEIRVIGTPAVNISKLKEDS